MYCCYKLAQCRIIMQQIQRFLTNVIFYCSQSMVPHFQCIVLESLKELLSTLMKESNLQYMDSRNSKII